MDAVFRRPARRHSYTNVTLRSICVSVLFASIALILTGLDLMSRAALSACLLLLVIGGAACGIALASQKRSTQVVIERAYSGIWRS